MTPRRILLLGWVVFLIYAYAGYLTSSSVDQLIDSRYDTIPDYHSPVMTKLWGVIGHVLAGPLGMLLLQSGLVLFGGFVLLRRVVTDRTAAITISCILIFPPVMTAVAVIGEDVLLASLLVGTAALFTSADRRPQLAGLILAMFACAMREGAWLAAAPIVIAGFVWRADRPLVRYAIATGAWLAAALVAYGLEQLVVERVTREPEEWLAYHDVAAMLANTNELSDSEVRDLLAGVRLAPGAGIQDRARRFHKEFDQISYGTMRLIEKPRFDEDTEALVAARARLRSRDLGSYVEARWTQWKRILTLEKPRRSAIYTKDNISRDHRFIAAHAHRKSVLQKGMLWFARLVEKTPLFSPFIYFAIALVLLPFARRDRVALTLLASGIVMELALAIVTWDVDYRYSTWLIVSTLIALVLVIKRRAASASPG
ncbi:MAG: hypothetical protein M4D80_16315 [Myxococcota bacterium]|nr:hypothetical protein [Myxococcota bacterium]